MIQTAALIIEDSDFTKDSNLKREAFDAICFADVVIHGTRVIKNRHTGITTAPPAPEPVKRVRRSRAAAETADVPAPLPTPEATDAEDKDDEDFQSWIGQDNDEPEEGLNPGIDSPE